MRGCRYPFSIAVASACDCDRIGNAGLLVVHLAGGIHNYERFYQDCIVYIVSESGGATPCPIVR
jgi:hypothetical protein